MDFGCRRDRVEAIAGEPEDLLIKSRGRLWT
jgi:hypothetical protein